MSEFLAEILRLVAAAWRWLLQYAANAREMIGDVWPVLKPFLVGLPDWAVLAIAVILFFVTAFGVWRPLRAVWMSIRKPSETPATRGDASSIKLDTQELLAGQDRQGADVRDIGAKLTFEPELSLREAPTGAGDRLFFFGAKDRIPFFGREQELNALEQWLLLPRKVSWALVAGPGGVGKSRLAFELAQRATEKGWRAGFLARRAADRHADVYRHFAPSRPTLIIIDYAAKDPEQVGAIFRTISDRAARFAHPVRYLLLEREGRGGQWWSRFASGQYVELDAADGLQLALDDPGDRPLLEIMAWAARPRSIPPPEDSLSELRKIDPQGRPFYAALVGAAIKDGREMRQLSRKALENDLLKRESERWNAAAGGNVDAVRRHRNAVALATMVGGLHLPEEVGGLDAASFPFSGNYDDTLVREMTGKSAANVIAPIEPDIVGERFVLLHLACRDIETGEPWNALSAPISVLREAAHAQLGSSNQHAEAFASFLDRLAADCSDEAFESGLYRPPSSDVNQERLGMWAAGARSAVARFALAANTRAALEIYSELKALSASIPDSERLATEAALAAANLINLGGADETVNAAAIGAELKEMSASRPDNTAIAAIATGAAFGLRVIEDMERVFADIKVPTDERSEVVRNLWDAINADFLVRLGKRLTSEQQVEIANLGEKLGSVNWRELPRSSDYFAPKQQAPSQEREGALEVVVAFFRKCFSEAELIDALTEAKESVLGEFAQAMRTDEEDPAGAEDRYQRAIEADPNNAEQHLRYAYFLENVRKDLNGAEAQYKRAIIADPSHSESHRRYAHFLKDVRQDMAAAEVHYKHALEIAPDDANNLCRYAYFLENVRKDLDGAEAHYKRALGADPNHADSLHLYALFLKDIRQDIEHAAVHYKRAMEGDPKNANPVGSYAQLMLSLGRTEEGAAALARAFEFADNKTEESLLAELNIYQLAHLPTRSDDALAKLKKLVVSGIRSSGWNFSMTLARAPADGCTRVELLADLIEVIANEADPSILDKYPDWRAA